MLDRIVERPVPRRGAGLEPRRVPTALRASARPASPSSPGRLWIRGQPTPHNPRRLSPCVDTPVDNYTLVFPHLCPQMWMNHRGVLSALSFMAARAARCFSGAVRLVCCLLTSETCGCHDFRDTRSGGNLGQAGGPGAEGGAKGKRSGGAPGRAGARVRGSCGRARRLRHRSSCTALWLTSALGPLVVVGRRPRPESA